MLLACIRGEAWPRVPPPPYRAERRLGYPQANFFYFSKQIFYFFLPYPITSSIHQFFLSLRGLLFLCVYFPTRVSFRVSDGKKRGNVNCFSYSTCAYVVVMRSILILYSHSLLCFSVVFLSCISLSFYSPCYVLVLSFIVDAVFFADLPILLPSVGFSPSLRVIIRLGVFRGSEAEKIGLCCGWVVYIRKKGGRDICVSHPPYVFGWLCLLCHFLCRNDVVLLCGLSVLTFPVTVGVMLS